MNTSTSPTQVAIVTGARDGIGREVVARLFAAGHRVAAVGRDTETRDTARQPGQRDGLLLVVGYGPYKTAKQKCALPGAKSLW